MAAEQPHDAIFKATLRIPENLVGVLRALLPPAVVEAIDLGRAELIDPGTVDESLRQRFADRVACVRLVDPDREAYVLVVFQHQSTVDPMMPVRVFLDIAGIWSGWLASNPEATSVPAVIPIVVHQGASAWTGPRRLAELIDLAPDAIQALAPHLPALELLIDDLAPIDVDELRARPLAASGRAALILMRGVRTGEVREAIQAVWDLLPGLPETFLMQLIRYLGSTTELTPDEVLAIDARGREPAQESDVITTFDQLRLQEAKRLLLRLLRQRFTVEPRHEALVAGADPTTVERWFDRVISASTADEVLGS